jgi:hypothetical protein
MSDSEPPLPERSTSAPALRASDADRERVVALLRDSGADGRLTLGELTERIDRAYLAKTLADLDELTGDLVAGGASALPDARPAAGSGEPRKARNWAVAVMGGSSRRGRWRVARQVNAISVMGGVDLDLRDAQIEGHEVTINALTIMGGIDICVPEGVEVELKGFILMGGKDARIKGRPRPGGPVVRVRAWGTMGGVSVHTPKRRRDGDDAPRDDAAGHLGHG